MIFAIDLHLHSPAKLLARSRTGGVYLSEHVVIHAMVIVTVVYVFSFRKWGMGLCSRARSKASIEIGWYRSCLIVGEAH